MSAGSGLSFAAWRATYETLHMWLQIVGKTRLALAPMQNHWWQIALYVTPRGLTTSAIPHENDAFAVDMDFVSHELAIRKSDGARCVLPLRPQSVASFYQEYTSALRTLGISVKLMGRPVEVVTAIPFDHDHEHASYDADAVHRWWQMVVDAHRVMQRFAGTYVGKASPVHFFWGSFDLAYTRFSGRTAPRHPGGAPNCPDYVMVEAYSHECTSCGFWPGGEAMPEPAFYAYAYPEPAGFSQQKLGPRGTYYNNDLREFILPWESVRSSPTPDETLLDFLQSAYGAAANLGKWDRAALERHGSIK